MDVSLHSIVYNTSEASVGGGLSDISKTDGGKGEEPGKESTLKNALHRGQPKIEKREERKT